MKGSLFSKYIDRIDESQELSETEKLKAWYRLYNLILEELSEEDNIVFTTLFSRIAFVGARWKIAGRFLFLMHALRRGVEQELVNEENLDKYISLARVVCVELTNKIWNKGIEQLDDLNLMYKLFQPADSKSIGFSGVKMGLMVEWDSDNRSFTYIDNEDGVEEWTVQYDISHKNEIFTSVLESAFFLLKPPIHINLIDVEVQEGKVLIPNAFVIEPDYMIDVTAIANAFKPYGTEPMENIINKFRPMEMSVHLLIGNIANYLLDELINDPDQEFQALIPKIFTSNPLTFACMNDQAVNETLQIIYSHFVHLKKVVNTEFKKEGIGLDQVYLEPAYYSRTYGIQGRLDLLHEHKDYAHYDIVELKSGSPYRPNNYGLSVQHYTQTLLYDLIIKSVYEGKRKTSNYILYSKEAEWNLRNAPVMKVQQYEAIKVRNSLVIQEHLLRHIELDKEKNILDKLRYTSMPKVKGFTKKHLVEFSQVYDNLNEVEKKYFSRYTKFISREHHLAKVGQHGLSTSNGLAAMWLEDKSEKEDRFSILYALEIIKNQSDSDIPLIHLKKSSSSPNLQKFRKGDIVVLYPDNGPQSVLRNQIFKCNIIEIDDKKLVLKLRSRQYNHKIFRDNSLWVIEGDVMDSSFLSMYRSLYSWANSSIRNRSLLLGKEPPGAYSMHYEYSSDELTEEQNHLINQAIRSKDYYLLWGPPGTGKTSIMIKHLIRYLYYYTEERILVCAYTNRAVDELCGAVLDALEEETYSFIRVGSSHATAEKYVPYLLDQKVRVMSSRREIIQYLSRHRIILSTVSSIVNRTELFHLYPFDSIIIDEASQILEPMIVGLLSRFKKWIMVGDHKQLPAVVVQNPSETRIKDNALAILGIIDTRMSLFERLYQRCVDKGWNHAYGLLQTQGRMHKDLMDFPSQYFYGGQLKVMKNIKRLSCGLQQNSPDTPLSRLIYIPTDIDQQFSWKTNKHEARICAFLVNLLIEQEEFEEEQIGIITPYRAQIALLSRVIHLNNPNISIDTVERYQGGARDVVILSLCTNRQDQLENLVSPSHEGIDRKLNVAITRARQRLFIVGNDEILKSDSTYNALIKACTRWEPNIEKETTQRLLI